MAKASILIVTYNGLWETTAPCLESLFAHTDVRDFEVIVVDNHSQDDTPAYLAALAQRETRLKCRFNETNRGFAGGNNDALAMAKGGILVFLNSDTLVTPGWLDPLGKALEEDRTIGLVGPVSNAVGNEQQIFTGGASPEEVIAEGSRWSALSAGESFPTARLGFFCAATRRDVVERVGTLDESYGLGFYEDDDYCLRVRRAGYRLVCREDVFVYHRGGGSFGAETRHRKDLLRRNLAYLESKFGITYRPPHPRERYFDVLESYLVQAEHAGMTEGVRYRIANRMQSLKALAPRGLFKRLKFARRMAVLQNHLRLKMEPCKPELNRLEGDL